MGFTICDLEDGINGAIETENNEKIIVENLTIHNNEISRFKEIIYNGEIKNYKEEIRVDSLRVGSFWIKKIFCSKFKGIFDACTKNSENGLMHIATIEMDSISFVRDEFTKTEIYGDSIEIKMPLLVIYKQGKCVAKCDTAEK